MLPWVSLAACQRVTPGVTHSFMRLQDWLDATNSTHAGFAETVRVTRETVTRWATGVIVPDMPQIVAIEDATKGAVTANDWATVHRARATA